MKGDVTKRITALLDQRGIKSNTFCREIGISTSTLSTWRKRGTDPDVDMLSRIREFFGASYSYLIDGSLTKEEIISDPERALLEAFREVPEDSREKFMNAFKATLQIYNLGREDERKAEATDRKDQDPVQDQPEEMLQAK